MKKIVFVIGMMGNGGAERVIAALSNQFVKNGIGVRIITIYTDQQDYPLDESVKLVPIRCKNPVRLFRPIERIRLIRRLIEASQPDCVVSFLADVNIHTLLAMKGSDIPVIVSERNDPKRDPKSSYKRKIRDRIYSWASGYVFQTPDAMAYFKNIIPDNAKTAVIPNPLTDELPFYEFDPSNRRLITACRLNVQKNLPLMIDAVGDVIADGRECTLDIYGSGPLEQELTEYIQKKKLENSVFLKGFSKDIHREMCHSAAFIISSDYEGISNSMLEALAIGVPVIATDCPVGGARMFIQNGQNGFLTQVGNRQQLAESIKLLLDNPQKAFQMGQKASDIRTVLNADIITKKWRLFIDEIISG